MEENAPPPSRHAGSRLITRGADLVRAVADMRSKAATDRTKIRREEISFSAVSSGVPCTSATMTDTHDTRMTRTGYALFINLVVATGTSSVVEARISVPSLAIFGSVVTTPPGGGEREIQATLNMPDAWDIGSAYRVYVQARRIGGGDATTVRVLRAWQR